MTPDERQMIGDLFERMRSLGAIDKDREAEGFINQNILTTPDAAYKLVQTVLVQENALNEAQGRIEELEEQMRQMQGQRPAQQSGGGFLGGMFGGRQQPAQATAVPTTGHRSPGFGQAPAYQQQPQGASPWNRQPQQQQQPMQPQPAQASSGGGFFRGALGMAAGVAGGVLAANAISNMMGGSKGDAQAGQGQSADANSGYEVNSADQGGGHGYQDEESNDPGNSDGGSWGGDDGSSL